MSKILTVFGATGKQGGSVVRTVLSQPELSSIYKVRAVTRDPSKASAAELKKLGADVVQGDQNDAASLRTAIKGSYAVFSVTNFWEDMNGPSEEAQGKAVADAAVAEGVRFIIYSSLPSPSRVSDGKLSHIHHFEHKARVEEYIKTLPIQSAFYWPSLFMQNFQSMFSPKRNEDGTFTLSSTWNPDSKAPLIDIASDTGKFLTPALLNPDAYHHKRIYGAAAFYTPTEIVDIWSKGLGKTIRYQQVPDSVYQSFLPEAIALEMTENMTLVRDHLYFGHEGKGAEAEVAESVKSLAENPVSWEEFVKNNDWSNVQ